MKNTVSIILALLLAIGIVLGLPFVFKPDDQIDTIRNNEKSLVLQEVISYGKEEKLYHKIYNAGELIGVITDYDYLKSLIAEKYKDFENEFPDTELGFGADIVISPEYSYAQFSNVDDQIMSYLVNHNLLGIKTTSVELSTEEGVFEIIYVKHYEDFTEALQRFLLNFISEDTLQRLMRQEAIESPTELGSVEKNMFINEMIEQKTAIVNPNVIFKSVDDIYNFLCYGRSTEREYYTTKEGDTLQGVGYYFGDMSTKQLVTINPNILKSENQIITPGMELNVTYFKSPIEVIVTKENLTQQYFAPDVPEYVEDDSLEVGVYEVRVEEEMGIKNVLYDETWVNGILTGGEMKNEIVIKQPKQGVIAVGTKVTYMIGTGQFIWPVDNPSISCHFGCYPGHTGTDIINRYVKYADIYAMDSGVVATVGYQYDMGNYCVIDHNNGIRTMYMHLNVPAFVEVGQNVTRGQIIGQMGNTGASEGVHLHVTFEVNGYRVNACNYLPCSLV